MYEGLRLTGASLMTHVLTILNLRKLFILVVLVLLRKGSLVNRNISHTLP